MPILTGIDGVSGGSEKHASTCFMTAPLDPRLKRLLRDASVLAARGVRSLGRAAGRARSVAGRRLGLESLKVKLGIGSTLVAAAILLVTYATLSAAARGVAYDAARKRVTELLSYFSGIFAEAVAANDRMQIHLLAQAILQNGVQSLSITDASGKPLFSSKPDLPEEDIFKTKDLKAVDEIILGTTTSGGESLIHAACPVRFGDRPVGMIHVWLNRMGLEGEIHDAQAFIYPILVSGFLLMVILVVVVLQTPFRALKRLTLAARQIGEGDLSGRVPVKGEDEVAEFSRAFNAMVDGLYEARQVILKRHLEIVQAMITVVEAKDSYTQGHCVRVQGYARRILERLEEIPPDEKVLIETAALLHDVGKIGIPDHILLKERRLTQKEMSLVREHVIIGEKILLHMDSLKEVARWVRHHHERWDGLGYPDGLRGEAIPLASRVIGVADALDAMMTDRPYRRALSQEKAIRALTEGKETQFDPRVVDSAIAFLASEEKESVEVYA
jgi:putative nucleotidyltransferase with HDIG domain